MFKNKSQQFRSADNPSQGRAIAKMPPDSPIQCKIGFEVEFSNWCVVEALNEDTFVNKKIPYMGGKVRSLKIGEKILSGDRFTLEGEEADLNSSCLEIVSIPFEENEDGFRQMMLFFQDLETFEETLRPRMPKSDLLCLSQAGLGVLHMPMVFVIERLASVGMAVQPQSTMGIKMDRLYPFFKDIGIGSEDETADTQIRKHSGRLVTGMARSGGYRPSTILMGKASMVTNKALEIYWNTTKPELFERPSDTFRGFFNMVVYYLISGRRRIMNYAKAFTKLLARTDFAKMFTLLPPAEREWFSKNDGVEWNTLTEILSNDDVFGLERDDWEDFTEHTGMETSFESITHFDPSDPFFARGIYGDRCKYHDRDMFVLSDLSSGEWLRNIPQGKDLLTQKHFPHQPAAWRLESLGNMGDQTDPGYDGSEMPIFEMRGHSEVKSMREIRENMSKWFAYIYELNRGSDYKYGEDHPFLKIKTD
ncbi:hypothetical protein FUAX_49420 (plasmid) [Fulvitalea axinellae]|uniref:Uncharacterized protein n=1 Tax=Fulvitalea axinellae TaxID=1182444 RepID=A0AAU9DIV8_9BACT|nr:hypothetical protein FUAX_49420 [Fulvitalea axinellae]